jgi:alpha-beta hydrolase superfamily lysophospholipase
MTVAAAVLAIAVAGAEPATEKFALRGKTLDLHLYGARGGRPVVLVSGDGGWMHLAPQTAPVLAARGYFVVGLSAKEYLSAFTGGHETLSPADVPRDFESIVEYAAQGAEAKPILVGISEGAGLAVLAAVDPAVKKEVGGVVGLGMSDRNELAWRLRDSIIYITHQAPREPGFSVLGIVDRLAPVPLALLQSTHDEYVPLEEARRVFEKADFPKRLWVIEAQDHRFSGGIDEFTQRLLEAMDWVVTASR